MDKFWMVWKENDRDPRFKHPTETEARLEAERLARMNPGIRFYILESIDACKMHDIVWANKPPMDSEPF